MKFRKGDAAIIVVILIAVLGWFLYSYLKPTDGDRQIVIEINGEPYQKIPMNSIKEKEKLHIELKNDKHIDLEIDQNGVYVEDVTCPDKICQKTGIIRQSGQSIVCLPNKIMIYIESKDVPELDGVSY